MSKSLVTRLIIAAGMVAALELAAQPAPAPKAAPSPETAKQIPSVIRTDYYEVRGATAEALLASMRAHQRSTNHAFTEWHIDWSYEYPDQAGRVHSALVECPGGADSLHFSPMG